MPKNQTESGVSEETLGYLDDVRKGKPRRFVMVCKGTAIVSLVVYKKGSVEKYKKEAKEAGSGMVSYGVVDGKGPKINFKLARADGFEREPTSTAKLKAYLKESAELTCSPLVEIVDAHSPLLDADDPLVARFLKLGESALLACDNHPDRAEEIYAACSEIGKILDADPSSDAAFGQIGKLEKLLSGLLLAPPPKVDDKSQNPVQESPPPQAQSDGIRARLAGLFSLAVSVGEGIKGLATGARDYLLGAEETSTDSTTKPDAPPLDPEAAKFKNRLSELLKQATPYVPTIGAELKAAATEARSCAEQGNYAEANEKLKQLVALIKQAKSTPTSTDAKEQMALFTERVGNLKPNLERLKAGDTEAKLKASEAASLVKQGAGFTQKNDFEEAFGLLTQAEELALAAVDELKDRQEKLEAARVQLRSARNVCSQLKTQVTSDLGSLPPDLADKFAKIEQSLALEQETDPTKIEQAADESGDAVVEIDTAAKELIEEKRAYEADLLLIEGRIKAMESHAKATVQFVAAKIAEIKNQVAAAKLKADQHEYADAATSLREVAKASLAAEQIADQHAEYSAVLADRDQLVLALPFPAPHVDIGKLVTAVRKKLSDAKLHATQNEFGPAVALLHQIPQDSIDVQWAAKRCGEYNTKRTDLDTRIKAREKEPDVLEVGLYLDKMRELYANSDYALTQDFTKSLTLLERALGMNTPLYKAIELLKEFRKQRKNADDKIKALENHAGKEGIPDPIARMKSDLTFADNKKTAHEYVAATNVCLNIIKLYDEAKKKADECKAYLDRQKEVADKKGTITGDRSDQVADLIGACDTLVSEAETKATAKDYVEAKVSLDAAMIRCQNAEAVFKNLKWAKGVQDGAEAAINNLAADFNAAYAKFTGAKNAVTNYDQQSDFTAEVEAAQLKADNARSEATKQPTPDPAAAQQLLREAIADVAKIAFLVDEKNVYEAIRKPLADRATALKSPAARGTALADEIKAIEDRLAEAKAEADNKKYSAAENKLTAAAQARLEADKQAKFYDDYMSLRDPPVKNAVAAVDTVDGRKALDTEVAKLKENLTKADELKTNKKLEDALKALKLVKADADVLKKKLDACTKARSEEKLWVTDKIGAIKDKPAVAEVYERVQKMQERLKTMFDERRFVEAEKFTDTIYWQIRYATDTLQRQGTYVVERDKAKDAIDKLKLVACEAIKDDIKTMENFYGKAEAFAQDGNYETGMPHLATVLQGCVQPTAAGQAFALYAPALKAAQEAVAALRQDFPRSEAVALAADARDFELAAIKKVAAQKSFGEAKNLAEKVTAACVAARQKAAAQKEFDDAQGAAANGPQKQVDGMEAEIAKLRELANKLTSRNLGEVLKEDLARIDKLLTAAEQERVANNAAKAREHLKSAGAACSQANATADQYVQVDQAIKDATSKIDSIRQKYAEPAFLRRTLDTLDNELLLARRDADGKTFSAALNEIVSVNSQADAMADLGAQHTKYLDERKKVDPRVAKLAESNARYIIAKEIGEIRAYVAESQGQADARDYREAMKLLAGADDLCDGAALQADMHEEKPVSADAIDKILKKPDGDKQLDKIIKTLDPKAQRKVCKIALEKRFKINLELFTDSKGDSPDTSVNKKAPDIVKFYEIMQALPKSHTRDNPSLDKVQRLGDDVGTSSYNKYSRNSELRIGRATDKTERMIAQEWEMGEVDDNAKPSDNEPPTKFSWTTLHEIGHAVDDRLGVMRRNGSQAEYGGWKEYGADVGEIAKVAADHFQYDQKYIVAYLSKENLPPPAPSGVYKDVDPAVWDQRRIEAETWCDSIRSDKSIYYNASATNRTLIGDKKRVYQEAYSNRWVSYLFEARRKAVAGYQFRAPGEWFAEVYASYHTGKMNKAHPARAWLDKMK